MITIGKVRMVGAVGFLVVALSAYQAMAIDWPFVGKKALKDLPLEKLIEQYGKGNPEVQAVLLGLFGGGKEKETPAVVAPAEVVISETVDWRDVTGAPVLPPFTGTRTKVTKSVTVVGVEAAIPVADTNSVVITIGDQDLLDEIEEAKREAINFHNANP